MSGKVCVGYIRGDHVHGAFMESLLRAMAMPPFHIGGSQHQVTSRLAMGRNDVVKLMLEDGDYEWLWMLDTDAVFPPDILNRMMEAADPKDHPVVGALCFAGLPYGPLRPTIYVYDETEHGPRLVVWHNYPRGRMVRAVATGAHCLLVHRTVLEDVREHFGAKTHMPWFQDTEVEMDGGIYSGGEDVTFCIRAQIAGHSVWVHTGIECGHLKVASMNQEAFDRYEALAELRETLVELDEPAPEPELKVATVEQTMALNRAQRRAMADAGKVRR